MPIAPRFDGVFIPINPNVVDIPSPPVVINFLSYDGVNPIVWENSDPDTINLIQVGVDS